MPSSLLDRLRADPALILEEGLGKPARADAWQAGLLRGSAKRLLLNCSRQSGKTLVSSALALRAALLHPPALVLILSPSLRQSQESYRAGVQRLYNGLGRPVPAVQESALQMTLANGSRVVALPGQNDGSIRGYSGVTMLICDECARIPAPLYRSIRPMLATSGGSLVCLSTPWGGPATNWWAQEWFHGQGWERVKITALQCERIPRSFLQEEYRTLGDAFFRQEYMGEFFDRTGDTVFLRSDIQAALDDSVQPLFPPAPRAPLPSYLAAVAEGAPAPFGSEQ
jgi:hypothetical protein